MTSPPATPDTTTIVRDLARRGPYCDVVHGGMAWGCRDCGVLDLQILLASDSAIYRPVYHRPGCLWRRAVEAAGTGAWTPPAAEPSSDDGRGED
jgi:hypothetical protein